MCRPGWQTGRRCNRFSRVMGRQLDLASGGVHLMRRFQMTVACVTVLFAGALRAQEPQGAAPTLRVVSNVDRAGQSVSFRDFEIVPVTEQRKVTETIMKDGQVIQVERAVPVTTYKTVVKETAMSVKGAVATDGTGQKLTTEQALGRLKRGQA